MTSRADVIRKEIAELEGTEARLVNTLQEDPDDADSCDELDDVQCRLADLKDELREVLSGDQ